MQATFGHFMPYSFRYWETVKPMRCTYSILTLVTILIAGSRDNLAAQTERNNIAMQTKTAQSLLAQADSAFNAGQVEQSRGLFQAALKEAEVAGDTTTQVESLAMIARSYFRVQDFETGMQWLGRSEKMAVDTDPVGWSRFLSVKGRLLWLKKQNSEAAALFKTLYHYCSQRSLSERAIDAANMVVLTGSPEEQVEWGKRAISEAESGNVSKWLGPLWNNLGAGYEERGQYDSALEAYTKARHYHWQNGTEKNKLVADWAVGHIYLLLKRYDDAASWLRPVITWAERVKDTEFIGLALRDLAEVDLAGGKRDYAHSGFVRAEVLLKEAGMPEWDAAGYQKIQNRIKETESK